MNPQQGQIKDLQNVGIKCGKINIVCEAGNDNGQTFKGEFLAKCGRKLVRINNGKLIKIIAK